MCRVRVLEFLPASYIFLDVHNVPQSLDHLFKKDIVETLLTIGTYRLTST